MKNPSFKPCKNSSSGKHHWLYLVLENKEKPEQCVLCNQLKKDLVVIPKNRGKRDDII